MAYLILLPGIEWWTPSIRSPFSYISEGNYFSLDPFFFHWRTSKHL